MMRAPRCETAMSSRRTTRSKCGAKPLVVAHHDHARSRLVALREKKFEERAFGIAIECRGRLVGDDDLRCADQRTRGGHALLLADAQARGSTRRDHRLVETERREATAPQPLE